MYGAHAYPFGLGARTWTPYFLVIKHSGPTSVSTKSFPPSKPDLYKKLVPTQGKMPRTELNQLYKKVAQLSWLTPSIVQLHVSLSFL